MCELRRGAAPQDPKTLELLNPRILPTVACVLPRFLGALKAAGLGSLPGTAAEVLHDGVRAQLCPDKLSADEWLHVRPVSLGIERGGPWTCTCLHGWYPGTLRG